MDDGWRVHDAHISHLPQTHVAAAGRINQQLGNIFDSVACCGGAPHDHIEHLLLLEKAADLNARQQGGRRPAHIAWFYPKALG